MRYSEITETPVGKPVSMRADEQMVCRRKGMMPGDKPTIIAVNPTIEEWNKEFPTGAAGVYCKGGTVAIGDGNCLAHDAILGYAKINQDKEKYRLQLCRSGAWVELWLDVEEGAPREEVLALVVDQYGETLEQIEAQVKPALQRFMGPVPVKVVPLNDDQDTVFPEDQAFVRTHIVANLAL